MEEVMDALLALAKRCEREEPSQLLDRDIALATGWICDSEITPYRWRAPDGMPWLVPRLFSASLDAAVTLVPREARWSIDFHDGTEAEVTLNTGRFLIEGDIERFGYASAPALALCAAALRARAAIAKARRRA